MLRDCWGRRAGGCRAPNTARSGSSCSLSLRLILPPPSQLISLRFSSCAHHGTTPPPQLVAQIRTCSIVLGKLVLALCALVKHRLPLIRRAHLHRVKVQLRVEALRAGLLDGGADGPRVLVLALLALLLVRPPHPRRGVLRLAVGRALKRPQLRVRTPEVACFAHDVARVREEEQRGAVGAEVDLQCSMRVGRGGEVVAFVGRRTRA